MKNSIYFPMFINIENKNIVIFGAGKIALRRTKTLIKTGCNIKIIAPEILEDFYKIEYKNIEIIKDIYKIEYLKDNFIALAITDNKNINEKIYEDCKKLNIIINVASNKEKCDFFFPAIIDDEGYVIGVCGDGKDHSFVKKIVEKIKNILKVG